MYQAADYNNNVGAIADEYTSNTIGAMARGMSAYMILCLPPLMFMALLLAILYSL